MKQIVLLGSTGSIGNSVLDIVTKCPEQFSILGLAARRSDEKLEEQIRMFRPRCVALADSDAAQRLRARIDDPAIHILDGPNGVTDVATHPESDLVISAIVGGAGLVPTLAAIRAGRQVALANKEPMVMAGQLMQEEARRQGMSIFPIDSEHSAIFQSLVGHRREDISRIILTASGGPFWDCPQDVMERATPEQALQHPNWEMGSKITIDSATLMNKGLEVIEAHWLFECPPVQLDVVIHRESVVHSLVEYCDGSVIAQLGLPDMRTPISYAMNYPERVPLDLPRLELWKFGTLTFEQPDHGRFPCLKLAYESLERGGTCPAILNGANEVAVDAFLNHGLPFGDIARVIDHTLQRARIQPLVSLEDALDADRWARDTTSAFIHSVAP